MPERAPSRLHGFIDGVVEGHVFGWVLDTDEPQRRLTVSGEIDGISLGSVEASEPRRDLRSAGIGDGSSGFRLPLGSALGAGEHQLSVVVHPDREPLVLSDDWVALDDEGHPLPGVVLRKGVSPTPDESGAVAAAESASPPHPATDLSAAGGAVLGGAGWLFERPATGFDGLRGLVRPSHAMLDRLVADIETQHADAREAGAASFVACLPDKLHVYPEHLPAGLAVDPAGRTAALMTARLRDRQVDLIDLLAPLLDARTHGRLFPRTGTSLTWTGAFHAYRALAKMLVWARPDVTAPAIEAIDLGALGEVADTVDGTRTYAWIGRRAVEVIGAGDSSPRDREPMLGDIVQLRAVKTEPDRVDGEQRWERLDRPELPTAIVVSGAAGRRVARFLVEQFSRCIVVDAEAVSAQLVRSHWPDLVIQLTSDRSLATTSASRG